MHSQETKDIVEKSLYNKAKILKRYDALVETICGKLFHHLKQLQLTFYTFSCSMLINKRVAQGISCDFS